MKNTNKCGLFKQIENTPPSQNTNKCGLQNTNTTGGSDTTG